jgi:NAD(P)-dependent dehydrogenase (short-subunit alcohol dehydrogenase family)
MKIGRRNKRVVDGRIRGIGAACAPLFAAEGADVDPRASPSVSGPVPGQVVTVAGGMEGRVFDE